MIGIKQARSRSKNPHLGQTNLIETRRIFEELTPLESDQSCGRVQIMSKWLWQKPSPINMFYCLIFTVLFVFAVFVFVLKCYFVHLKILLAILLLWGTIFHQHLFTLIKQIGIYFFIFSTAKKDYTFQKKVQQRLLWTCQPSSTGDRELSGLTSAVTSAREAKFKTYWF